jgi:hypothetical protein
MTDHPLRQLRLRHELDFRGHVCFTQTRLILTPALGQIQRTINQRTTTRTGQRQEHAHLTVLNATRRPRILTLHARRLVPLLQEPRLVHDQHTRVTLGQQVPPRVMHQLIPHRVGVPRRAVQQSLDRVRRRIAHVLGRLPPVLPPHRPQQPPHVRRRPLTQVATTETPADLFDQLLEVTSPSLNRTRVHAHHSIPPDKLTVRPRYSSANIDARL